MELPPSPPSQEKEKTYWHEYIMAERNLRHDHSTYLNEPLDKHVMFEQRENCLVLGDASHVVTNALVEKKYFEHATVVDSDPLVLDEFLFKNDDKRFTKVPSDFVDYFPPENTFNFVYGKSIAFVPKDKIAEVLSRIHASLKAQGVLCAVYAGKDDTFRPVHYTKKELEDLHKGSGFRIVDINETSRRSLGLVGTDIGHVHEFVLVARKD